MWQVPEIQHINKHQQSKREKIGYIREREREKEKLTLILKKKKKKLNSQKLNKTHFFFHFQFHFLSLRDTHIWFSKLQTLSVSVSVSENVNFFFLQCLNFDYSKFFQSYGDFQRFCFAVILSDFRRVREMRLWRSSSWMSFLPLVNLAFFFSIF